MTRKQPTHISLGEFVPPGPNWAARRIFLDRVRLRAARSIEELATTVVDKAESLEKWASRWCLTDPWLTAAFTETVSRWQRHPGTLRHRQLAPLTLTYFEPHWPELRAWDPTVEKEVVFLKRVKAHVNECRKLAREGGFVQADSAAQIERDIEWLVQFQVLGRSVGEIADRDRSSRGVEPSAVTMAIRRAAELCGVTLREARRGRPT